VETTSIPSFFRFKLNSIVALYNNGAEKLSPAIGAWAALFFAIHHFRSTAVNDPVSNGVFYNELDPRWRDCAASSIMEAGCRYSYRVAVSCGIGAVNYIARIFMINYAKPVKNIGD
jgi:hypothetical protein